MKYLDAYRDTRVSRDLLDQIVGSSDRSRTILEVCGGPAHNMARFGIECDVPGALELVHGPSCPTCATPAETVDHAVSIAGLPGVIVAVSGDVLRAPGSENCETLLEARGRGADVRSVYSPLDALALARKNPERTVINVAVGFETTAPAAAAALLEAERLGLENLAFLTAFFRLAPAVEALLNSADNRAVAVLIPGPVCAVTGFRDYEPIAERFRVPIIVTGPGPIDLLDAIVRTVRQIDRGAFEVENQYDRAVRPDGNPQGRAAIAVAFEIAETHWRGLGMLPASGLFLRDRFRQFDAYARYPEASAQPSSLSVCPASDVQSGRLKPSECPAFGTCCTPDHPLGPFMVSAEGVCAAYHRYRRSADNGALVPALSIVPGARVPES